MSLATTVADPAVTWDFLYPISPDQGDRVVAHPSKCISLAEPSDDFSGLTLSAALETCPADASSRFSRLLALDEILGRLRTEKGKITFARRFRGQPQSLSVAEEIEWVVDEAEADHDAETTVGEWAEALDRRFNLRRDGQATGFILPARESGDRWQTKQLWVEGVLNDRAVVDAPAMKRMAKRHVPALLEALADFVDSATGHTLCASHATVARRARKLVQQRPELDPGGRGKPLAQLSDSTLEKNVKTFLSTLRRAGWAIERATGRHLKSAERCVAKVLFGASQDRAASVHDLVTPERAWITEKPRPTSPGWATPKNPFIVREVVKYLLKTMKNLAFSSPYPMGLLPTEIINLIIGLLKKTQAIEKQSPPQRKKKAHRFAGVADPSRAAQRITTDLRKSWGWLLPKNRNGKRMDARVIARIIDAEGAAHLTAKKIKSFVDLRLHMNRWEFNPARITNKLGWFRTILRDLLGTAGENH